jgi:hypothetical protein
MPSGALRRAIQTESSQQGGTMMKNIGLTAAEKFWYVLGCIAFGAAYFKKVPVAKALSKLEQFKVAEHEKLQTLA